jgi:endogenous inhibitor of DNA gyrase (YacG/DUF329 family)
MQLDRKCKRCGKDFKMKDRWALGIFCSNTCKAIYNARNFAIKRSAAWENESEEQKIKALSDHLFKFIEKGSSEEECWQWIGCKVSGYGRFNHRGKPMKAHRVSWELFNNKKADGFYVCHTCDNPPCANPRHLFLGTNKDNMVDMLKKERCSASTLSAADVIKIKNLLKIGVTAIRLSKDFDVNVQTIYNIKHGKTWKHITI